MPDEARNGRANNIKERKNNTRTLDGCQRLPLRAIGQIGERQLSRLPEWMELALGVLAILSVYRWIIWRYAFGAEDRVLFKR